MNMSAVCSWVRSKVRLQLNFLPGYSIRGQHQAKNHDAAAKQQHGGEAGGKSEHHPEQRAADGKQQQHLQSKMGETRLHRTRILDQQGLTGLDLFHYFLVYSPRLPKATHSVSRLLLSHLSLATTASPPSFSTFGGPIPAVFDTFPADHDEQSRPRRSPISRTAIRLPRLLSDPNRIPGGIETGVDAELHFSGGRWKR